MDYQVVLSRSSRKDLQDIVRYISIDDPSKALTFGGFLLRGLESFPRGTWGFARRLAPPQATLCRTFDALFGCGLSRVVESAAKRPQRRPVVEVDARRLAFPN